MYKELAAGKLSIKNMIHLTKITKEDVVISWQSLSPTPRA